MVLLYEIQMSSVFTGFLKNNEVFMILFYKIYAIYLSLKTER